MSPVNRAARLEARTSPGKIDITMTSGPPPVAGAAGQALGGCGSIGIDPVSPGTYEVSLYGFSPTGGRPHSSRIGRLNSAQ